jgi:uncharacterized membrane protein
MNVQYTFTATTVDPEGDNISFLFDWGDGNTSGWIGPYPSGGTGQATHRWAALGSYDVKVKAKDDSVGRESGWSPAHTFTIVEAPILKIDWIAGGVFTVRTLIKNNGGVPAHNITWTITLSGGAFIGKESTGTIGTLAPGEGQTVKSKLILGFGATVVTVNTSIPESSDVKTQSGTLLFFMVRF